MARGGVMEVAGQGQITALLGPTNTGKTHLALQRMLGHRTGMIGLPLRLLAREIYDRVVREVGEDQVALVTGEEKRVPAQPRYWVCTVESMPVERPVAFLAVDEIQLAGDRFRGHVFTDRLLHARGVAETWFLGAETIAPLLQELVPTAMIRSQPRLSTLRHAGHRKITALPPRTAVVAFSMREVYALAERFRARHGGAAVVLGALSPRARNAQVELYASGDVQYMVATDAIGMGLNLDVHHVALAGRHKFDGVEHRALFDDELGQIAGRAGRFRRDGTFGTTHDCEPLTTETIDRIEHSHFEPLRRLWWRNPELDTTSLDGLIDSLERTPRSRHLRAMLQADDARVLHHLAADPTVRALARDAARVRLLWAIARIPDFGKVLPEHHAGLLATLYAQLVEHGGTVPDAWLDAQVARLDRTDGDLGTLMARIAAVRTWTTVANQPGWTADPQHWQGRTRAIEDRLSDALHTQLTARFVDREASVLVRRLGEDELLEVACLPSGVVTAAGLKLGVVRGLRFELLAGRQASPLTLKAVRKLIGPLLAERAQALVDSPPGAFSVDRKGTVRWDGAPVARLLPGPRADQPKVKLVRADDLEGAQRRVVDQAVRRAAAQWLAEAVRGIDPDFAETPDERALLYAVRSSGGALARDRDTDRLLHKIPPPRRSVLGRHGLRFGAAYLVDRVAMAQKEAQITLHNVAWGTEVDVPSDGGRQPFRSEGPAAALRALGFLSAGEWWVRVDVLEECWKRPQDTLARLGLEPEDRAALRAALPPPPRVGRGRRRGRGRGRRR